MTSWNPSSPPPHLPHTSMAMQEDVLIKVVDLKVSVNCCEGCNTKVLKALNMTGVFKVEIHPDLPRVTVTGNVDVPVLVKKLAKVGKKAKLWPTEEEQQPQINTQTVMHPTMKHYVGMDDQSAIHPPPRHCCCCSTTPMPNHASARSPNCFNQQEHYYNNYLEPALAYRWRMDDQSAIHPPPLGHCCCCSTTPMPNHASARSPNCFNQQEHYYNNYYNNYLEPAPAYRPPPPPPPIFLQQTQATSRFDDFFNDDNTSGCRVM